MSSNTISMSAIHAAPVQATACVAPASTRALGTSALVAAAMWTKRNKGAAGAPGFWDPV
ncbi:MAG TPA: hypothetical protein VHB69_13420 [Mycobacteriales bacterium]|nr:hypothetical protein [Mycobacteriales bacterium]